MAINGSINLLKYNGARKVSLGGQKGIFIPVDGNPTIYVGDKGAYASVRIVEHESSFGDKTYTHFIAASIDSKKRRDELENQVGKEVMKQYTPILGNATDYNAESGGNYEEVREENYDDLPDGFYPESSGINLG